MPTWTEREVDLNVCMLKSHVVRLTKQMSPQLYKRRKPQNCPVL